MELTPRNQALSDQGAAYTQEVLRKADLRGDMTLKKGTSSFFKDKVKALETRWEELGRCAHTVSVVRALEENRGLVYFISSHTLTCLQCSKFELHFDGCDKCGNDEPLVDIAVPMQAMIVLARVCNGCSEELTSA